ELSAPAVLPKFVEYEQRFGSVVVGAIRNKAKTNGHAPVFQTLKSGMGTLIGTLTEQVALIRARVGSLAPAEEGWQLYADGAWHNFDRIVLACGANHSSALLASVDPDLSTLLAAIPYNGSSIWTFGYRAGQVKRQLDAFGFLVPRAERSTMMA